MAFSNQTGNEDKSEKSDFNFNIELLKYTLR